MSESLTRGALHATAAAAAFALMGAFAKAAALSGAGNLMIVFARNIVGVLALLPWILHHGTAALRTQRLGGHLWRSGFGLAGMATLYYAIAHLSLAEALLLNYSSPLFIPFLAWLVLGERPPAALLPATVLGLVGVALIVKPSTVALSPAALVGAASGLFAAGAMVSLRRISNTEPAPRIVFYLAFVGLLASSALLPWYGHWPDTGTLGLLLGTGIAATVGQLQLTRAYSCAPAARVAAMGYSAVIFAGLIGWLVWDEQPDAWSLLGAALVIGTCVLASWSRNSASDKTAPEELAS